jgi:hypothetical protein
MTEELSSDLKQGSEIFRFSITSRRVVRPTHFLYNWYRGLFLREQSGRSVKLSIHLLLVAKSRIVELYFHSFLPIHLHCVMFH